MNGRLSYSGTLGDFAGVCGYLDVRQRAATLDVKRARPMGVGSECVSSYRRLGQRNAGRGDDNNKDANGAGLHINR